MELESGGIGHAQDVLLVADQHMDAFLAPRSAIDLDEIALLRPPEFVGFLGVDADVDQVVIEPGVKGVHAVHRLEHARELHSANALAPIEREQQDDGALAEQVAQLDLLPFLVGELGVERQLLVEALIEPDFGPDVVSALGRREGRSQQSDRCQYPELHHVVLGAPSGSVVVVDASAGGSVVSGAVSAAGAFANEGSLPEPATSSIALATGTCARPAASSTQP